MMHKFDDMLPYRQFDNVCSHVLRGLGLRRKRPVVQFS